MPDPADPSGLTACRFCTAGSRLSGAVVHANAGAAALAAAIYLGRRKDYGSASLAPHNVPMVVLGAGILWFGWFGFNAGSALG